MAVSARRTLDVYAAIDRVKDRAPQYITNLFATPEQIQDWMEQDVVTYADHGRCLLLFRRDRDFQHLFHVASSLDALDVGLASLNLRTNRGPFAVDLVGQPEQIAPIGAIYREHGFESYTTLVRMSLLVESSTVSCQPDPEVEFARPADVPQVEAFLDRLLDRFVDQIPSAHQLLALAEQSSVLMVRCSGEIGGVLVSENTRVTSILRYWYVDSRFRDRGVGGKLLRTFLHLSAARKRILLWVVAENHDAIAKYQHYGFVTESLTDQILLRR